MKIFRRLPRKFKAAVVFSVIFTLLFPFTLMAETQYKVPKNSLSYFLQNPSQSAYLETVTDSETGAVIPPLTPVETQMAAAPAPVAVEIAPAPAATEPVISETVEEFKAPVPEQMSIKVVEQQMFTEAPPVPATEESAPVAMEPVETAAAPAAVEPAVNVQPEPVAVVENIIEEKKSETPVYTARVNVTPVATANANIPLISTNASSEEPVFSGVLARMQQNKAKRVAEAEKLGVVLPSQGGDIAAVSPSLSKIQQTLKTIMARQP